MASEKFDLFGLHAVDENLAGLSAESSDGKVMGAKQQLEWLRANYTFLVNSANSDFRKWLNQQPKPLIVAWDAFSEKFTSVFLTQPSVLLIPVLDKRSVEIYLNAISAGKEGIGRFIREIYSFDKGDQLEASYLSHFLLSNQNVFAQNSSLDFSLIQPVVNAWSEELTLKIEALIKKIELLQPFIAASFQNEKFGRWVSTLSADNVAKIKSYTKNFYDCLEHDQVWDKKLDAIDYRTGATVDSIGLFVGAITTKNYPLLHEFLQLNQHVYNFLADNMETLTALEELYKPKVLKRKQSSATETETAVDKSEVHNAKRAKKTHQKPLAANSKRQSGRQRKSLSSQSVAASISAVLQDADARSEQKSKRIRRTSSQRSIK